MTDGQRIWGSGGPVTPTFCWRERQRQKQERKGKWVRSGPGLLLQKTDILSPRKRNTSGVYFCVTCVHTCRNIQAGSGFFLDFYSQHLTSLQACVTIAACSFWQPYFMLLLLILNNHIFYCAVFALLVSNTSAPSVWDRPFLLGLPWCCQFTAEHKLWTLKWWIYVFSF